MSTNFFTIELNNNLKIFLLDILAILFILFLPTFSHLLPFPVYYLDPMRLVVLGVYFFNRNYKNALLVALTIPIFSMLYSGHPIFYKAILISLELFINIFILHLLFNKRINIFFSVLTSIILSKIFYYLFKFIFIEWSLISGKIFSTSLLIQLFIALGLSFVFYLFGRKIKQPSK